jgi:ABC-type transport system substrate-binding protein
MFCNLICIFSQVLLARADTNMNACMKKFVKVIICVLSAFLLTPGTAHGEAGVLNISVPGIPTTRDPIRMDDVVTSSIFRGNVYETLVRFGLENPVIEPVLATDWEVEQAGKVWIFNLRRDVTFHDGTPLTASDVIDSFGRIPGFNAEIVAEGDHRVKFILPRKATGFVKRLTVMDFVVVRYQGRDIFGTGPYTLAQWQPEQRVVLKAYHSYWGNNPDIPRVVFHCSMDATESVRMIRADSIDLRTPIPPSMVGDLSRASGIKISRLEGANISFVHINVNNPPLDSPEFRKALNYVIRKKKIIRDVLYGYGIECRGLFPPVLGGKKEGEPVLGYDPARGSRIIQNHLQDSSRVFKVIGLPFERPYCPEPDTAARLIGGYLRGAGLKLEYHKTESMKELLDYLARDDYDLIILGWIINSRSPENYLAEIFGLGDTKSLFKIHWRNENFERLVLSARKTVSIRKQWEYYSRAEEIFLEECPWILLAHTDKFGIYRDDLEDVYFLPSGELRLNLIKKK